MIKLKEPYMIYDDEKDVMHIYDGKAEVACIEHPLINLDYLLKEFLRLKDCLDLIEYYFDILNYFFIS